MSNPVKREPVWHGGCGWGTAGAFDTSTRRMCAIDLDRAREAKTDEALAEWVRKWGDNLREILWRN